MASYRLNLNQQPNGDYEVQEVGCRSCPEQNYDCLGVINSCVRAFAEAKRKYIYKRNMGLLIFRAVPHYLIVLVIVVKVSPCTAPEKLTIIESIFMIKRKITIMNSNFKRVYIESYGSQ